MYPACRLWVPILLNQQFESCNSQRNSSTKKLFKELKKWFLWVGFTISLTLQQFYEKSQNNFFLILEACNFSRTILSASVYIKDSLISDKESLAKNSHLFRNTLYMCCVYHVLFGLISFYCRDFISLYKIIVSLKIILPKSWSKRFDETTQFDHNFISLYTLILYYCVLIEECSFRIIVTFLNWISTLLVSNIRIDITEFTCVLFEFIYSKQKQICTYRITVIAKIPRGCWRSWSTVA